MVGVKEVIVGGNVETNENPERDAAPPTEVSLTKPEVPVPTTAVIVVGERILKEATDVPPRLTPVTHLKLFPLIVIVSPRSALIGVNESIVGCGSGIRENPDRAAAPPIAVNCTEPEEPVPTTAVIVVDERTLKEATDVPPKLTAVTHLKLVPLIVRVSN